MDVDLTLRNAEFLGYASHFFYRIVYCWTEFGFMH